MEQHRTELLIDILPRLASIAGLTEFEAQMRRVRGTIRDASGVVGGTPQSGNMGWAVGAANAGADIGMAAAAGVGVFGIMALKEATATEAAANRIRAAHQISQQDYASYSRFITDNSTKLLTSQTDLWQGIGDAIVLQFGTRGTEAVVNGAAKMARVFNTDFSSTMEGATKILGAFKVQADQVPAALDAMTAAAARSPDPANFFTTGAGRFMFQARSIGASFNESIGIASEVSRLGLGNRAVGALGGLLENLGGLPGKGYGAEVNIGKFGIEGSLANLLGQKWATPDALKKLLGGGINLTLARDIVAGGSQGASLGNTQGTLDQRYTEYLKSSAADLDKLRMSVQNFEDAVGRGLVPILKTATSELTPLIEGATHLAEKFPNSSKVILEGATALGLLSVGIKAVTALSKPLLDTAEKIGMTGTAASTAAPELEATATGIGNVGTAAAAADPEVATLLANLQGVSLATDGAAAKLDAESAAITRTGTAAMSTGKHLLTMAGYLGLIYIAAETAQKGLTDLYNNVGPVRGPMDWVAGIYNKLPGPIQGLVQGLGMGIPGFIAGAVPSGGSAGGIGSTGAGGSSATYGTGTPGSAFGLTGITYSALQGGWLTRDQNIMPATAEMNYGLSTGAHEQVHLPPGNWQVIRSSPGYNGGVGGVVVVQNTDTGQNLGFLHLHTITVKVGDNLKSGHVIGTSGWPLSSQYAVGGDASPTNAHLAVLYGPVPSGGVGGTSAPTITSPSIVGAVVQQENNPTLFPPWTVSNDLSSIYHDPRLGPAMRAHGLDPNNPEQRDKAALAIFNSGWGAPWWEKYYTSKYDDASKYPHATMQRGDVPRGMAYTATVWGIANLDGGMGGGTAQHAQPKPGQKYPTTPIGWASWWGTQGSKEDQMITDLFGPNIDISKLSPAERALLIHIVDTRNYDRYQQARSLINAEVPGGINSAAGRALLGQAAAKLKAGNANPLSAYKNTDPLVAIVSNLSQQYSNLGNKWQGVDPTTLGPTQQHQWLSDQYKRDRLWQEIHDDTALIKYHNHQISWNTYLQTVKTDKFHMDYLNQQARAHAEGNLGPVGRVAVERVTSQCAAEERANVHRKKTAESSVAIHKVLGDVLVAVKEGAGHTKDLKKHVANRGAAGSAASVASETVSQGLKFAMPVGH